MHDAWISASPPGVKVNAAYLEIRNLSGIDATLVRADSPRVDRIEMHLSEVRNGVAGMRRQDTVTIPAGGAVSFEPRGYHLMLFDAAPPLQIGETVPMTFEFSDGTVIDAAATVERRDGPDPAHHH